MLLVNASIIDTEYGDVTEGGWVRVVDGLIQEAGNGRYRGEPRGEEIVDCAGGFLMPGLIDAHTHMGSPGSTGGAVRESRAVYAARVFDEMETTLREGFTTIRDAGFTDAGFRDAVLSGLRTGPRMTVSNGPLSITGGHSDFRSYDDRRDQYVTDGLFWPGMVADGVEEVRRAVREVLRAGADHVKIMASGGCMSYHDAVTDVQYSVDELSAAVWEANCRGKHVLAHSYAPASILNCVTAGVRTIEHGNLLDEESAAGMSEKGVYLVPTLTIYETSLSGSRETLTAAQVEKLETVINSGYEALRIAAESGVKIGSGSDASDLRSQRQKALELELQARVQGAAGALRSATVVNAEIVGRSDLGRVAPGFRADLLLLDTSPLDNIRCLQDPRNIRMVMLDGRRVSERLDQVDVEA